MHDLGMVLVGAGICAVIVFFYAHIIAKVADKFDDRFASVIIVGGLTCPIILIGVLMMYFS